MNLEPLEALAAIAANNFSISAAAVALRRSQPTLTRQVQYLERELGVRVFVRTRNKVVGLTPKGEEILRIGRRIVLDARELARVASDEADGPRELKVGTTHLHARYLLPQVMKRFAKRFEQVTLTLRQGDPAQCCDLVLSGEADIAITTAGAKRADDLVAIPAFKLNRCIIAPRGHPVTREKTLTLKRLAKYPIVAYSTPFSGRWIVEEAFARAGLAPRIVCSAIDADVGKTYVEAGMGIAVLAGIAFDADRDRALTAMDAEHLFEPSVVNIVLRKHGYLSRYAGEFIGLFAPHLRPELVVRAVHGGELDRERLIRQAPHAGARKG